MKTVVIPVAAHHTGAVVCLANCGYSVVTTGAADAANPFAVASLPVVPSPPVVPSLFVVPSRRAVAM